jgi:hypothetical protein
MRWRCVDEPGLNIGDGVAERAAFARWRRLDGARQFGRVTPRLVLLRAAKVVMGLLADARGRSDRGFVGE